jgi:hypothetical protein
LTGRRTLGGAVLGIALVGLAGAWLLARGASSTPTEAMPAPRFVDEARSSGIAHTYDGDSRFYVGGGVAALDCDADGRPDLYLAGGGNPAALFRNRSEIGGELRFERVPDAHVQVDDVRPVARASGQLHHHARLVRAPDEQLVPAQLIGVVFVGR